MYTPASPSVPEMEGINVAEVVPLVEFIHIVFTRKSGAVIVGDSGLFCCVPCLSSAIISLRSVILQAELYNSVLVSRSKKTTTKK